MLPTWLFYVQAALSTLAQLSPAVIPLFHGGAANTASTVSSALQIAKAFADGTADKITATDVHPDIAAHAQMLADNHAQIHEAVVAASAV